MHEFDNLSPEDQAVADAAWDALADGTKSFDDLIAMCREKGLFEPMVPDEFSTEYEALDHALLWARGVWSAGGEMATRLDVLLAGAVFTHRLTDREIETELVASSTDLTVLGADVGDVNEPLTIPGVGTIELTFERDENERASDRLSGPPGWLEGFSAGDLVAFVRHSEGQVTLEVVDDVADGDAEADALDAAFLTERITDDAGVDTFPMMIDLLISDPALFRQPVAPVGELLARIGLESRRDHIGPADRDWLPPGVAMAFERGATLADEYGLEPCCRAALRTVTEAWRDHGFLDKPIGDASAVLAALDHGETLFTFGIWAYLTWGWFDRLEAFVEELADRSGRRAAPALCLLAELRMWGGDPLGAETAAHRALGYEPNDPEATALLARLASIRGNGKEALRLFRKADPGHLDVEFLAGLYEPYPDARRNDPCPCGVGRKYKVCCAVRPTISGSQRTQWLSQKLRAFIATPGREAGTMELARIAAGMDERSDWQDIARFSEDSFLLDVAAFDHAIGDFIDEWGPLLPDDERDTIELWALSDRRLWEVVDDPHESLIPLRDTSTGEVIEVYDVIGAGTIRKGSLVLSRVVPAFGADRAIGTPIIIDPRNRDSLLELLDDSPDAGDFAAWYGFVAAPPRLSTTEGQEMVSCTAVADPAGLGWEALEKELDRLYRRDDETEWTWSFTNDKGETVLRASLYREDNLLVITTLSEERMDDVLDSLPGIDILKEQRDPIRSPRDLEALRSPGAQPPEPLEMTPEIEELLREQMREMEDHWLDENIPALSGLTPREAAADPTRREDLIALLNSFDDMPVEAGLNGFDADRLRRELGLD
ncbi:MAG: SEC-C metal-binding domain-containing protein [Actinomycetota bacterium]|nr:SEC-C metal-binding domain-containing protein [Actinomycetota bacterium]